MILADQVVDTTQEEGYLMEDYEIDQMILNVAVSLDGSWKNRGLMSHHCVVAAISKDSEEVLDMTFQPRY